MSGKECRPRSNAAFCGIWSGSTLFAQSNLFKYLAWIWYFWDIFLENRVDISFESYFPIAIHRKYQTLFSGKSKEKTKKNKHFFIYLVHLQHAKELNCYCTYLHQKTNYATASTASVTSDVFFTTVSIRLPLMIVFTYFSYCQQFCIKLKHWFPHSCLTVHYKDTMLHHLSI